MKKAISIVLTAVMALTLFCTAVSADAVPQPEGGKKFESIWAKACGLIEIWYEEEGYRVMVDLFNQSDSTGTQWEYSCYYNEQKDILESVSARKFGYTLVPETMDVIPGECEYEEFGETDKTTVFSLTENGALKWEDGYENAGADLEFRDIGRFDGVWRNDAKEIYTEIRWRGLYDENDYCYSIFVSRGGEEQYASFSMEGLYDPEAGMLNASGTCTVMTRNAEGSYDITADGEACEACFYPAEDGKLLYETDHRIELEFDILGPES